MFTRAWRADFDIDDSEGRIVTGIAVPFNSPTQIFENGRTFDETWAPGSTKEAFGRRGHRIKILGHHDHRAMPLGKPIAHKEEARGAVIDVRISDTQAGNEALTLVRDGVLDGFSVGFTVPSGGDAWSQDDRQRTITRADIHEVSLVNFPAFDRARVESIREAVVVDGLHAFVDYSGDGFCDECGEAALVHPPMMEPSNENSDGVDLTVRHTLYAAHLQLVRARLACP